MLTQAIVSLALATLAVASPFQPLSERNNDGSPVIDLGRAGRYRGIVQNNGTVKSWKGISYAQVCGIVLLRYQAEYCWQPPIGELRFKGPKPLQDQPDEVQDVSDDALRCVLSARWESV